MEKYLETGEIVTTHGVRGEIKVYPWADSPEFLLRFSSFRIGSKDYSVEKSRVQGSCVLLKLAGIDSVEEASPLIHQTLLFCREGVKPDKGYFIADLKGLDVRSNGVSIGTLKDVLQYPGNDVWLVRGQKEYLIPAVPSFIHSVNVEDGFAEVTLLEGMATDEN